jgi:hypothetical protein
MFSAAGISAPRGATFFLDQPNATVPPDND